MTIAFQEPRTPPMNPTYSHRNAAMPQQTAKFRAAALLCIALLTISVHAARIPFARTASPMTSETLAVMPNAIPPHLTIAISNGLPSPTLHCGSLTRPFTATVWLAKSALTGYSNYGTVVVQPGTSTFPLPGWWRTNGSGLVKVGYP